MKVLLINPPRSWVNKIRELAPPEARKVIHIKLVGPPLGLLTVATAASAEHDVTIFDCKGEYDLDPATPPLAELVRRLMAEHRPDVVGTTSNASEFPYAMEILRTARSCDPTVFTVAGGVHATLCPEHFDDHPVDVLCTGEGTRTFVELLRAVEAKRPLDEVSGIRIREGAKLRPSRAIAVVREPVGRDFVMPDRSLLKRWIPTYVVGGDPRPITYLYTSLGCPARCTFCAIWPQFKGAYFQRDPDSIVEELRTLEEHEVVRFADADTAVDAEWVERLFDKIEAAGIKKHYVIDLRMDFAANNPRVIEKMAKGGVRIAITGFESPRAHELEAYKKGQEPRHIHEGFQVCEANGIKLRANYVVPGDYGAEDFKILADFASDHRAPYAGYTILTPLPGTVLYRQWQDRIVDHDLTKYNFFNCVVRTRLPLERFYEEVGKLWLIRLGTHTIS